MMYRRARAPGIAAFWTYKALRDVQFDEVLAFRFICHLGQEA
jgi:hypothetical protein